jgi:hypothetical protein
MIAVFGGRGVHAEENHSNTINSNSKNKSHKKRFVDYADVIVIDPVRRVVRRLSVNGLVPCQRFAHTTTAIGNGILISACLFESLDLQLFHTFIRFFSRYRFL